MPVGIYVSVPFCRTKCSYCNFASDVFSRAAFERYVNRVLKDIEDARTNAESMGGGLDGEIDSIYLGGGTPTILDSHQLERVFVTIRQNFCLQPDAEITVECAPGTLSEPVLNVLLRCGVNRVSLGVQSFVDQEAAAVGRQHKRATILDDMARLRASGISNINLDLIAGLPHQTAQSWQFSLDEAVASDVPHVSVYLLEIDVDSRLGREVMAGGSRYHAHFVPDEELMADLYQQACTCLEQSGVAQYEISNFARPGLESRHNLKYWTRQPYLGFGVDAHSMLYPSPDPYYLLKVASDGPSSRAGGSRACAVSAADLDAVRFATADSLEDYIAGTPLTRTPVSRHAALEETFFLGLRLTAGVDLARVGEAFGPDAVAAFASAIDGLVQSGLMLREGRVIRLTPRGRLLSNEVFQHFLADADVGRPRLPT